jgi:hypothetical protein
MLLPVLKPTMHGSGRSPNPTGDLSNPLPALVQRHGTTTALLQARCGSNAGLLTQTVFVQIFIDFGSRYA